MALKFVLATQTQKEPTDEAIANDQDDDSERKARENTNSLTMKPEQEELTDDDDLANETATTTTTTMNDNNNNENTRENEFDEDDDEEGEENDGDDSFAPKSRAPQEFNEDGIPIAIPFEYEGDSSTIITPAGIIMERTTRGAFRCGNCKYCSQPTLKQKCVYNNAPKRPRNVGGRGGGVYVDSTGMVVGGRGGGRGKGRGRGRGRSAYLAYSSAGGEGSDYVPTRMGSSMFAAGGSFFEAPKAGTYESALYGAKKFNEEFVSANSQQLIVRANTVQSKYLGFEKTAQGKIRIIKNFDLSKEAKERTVTKWTKTKFRIPNIMDEDDQEAAQDKDNDDEKNETNETNEKNETNENDENNEKENEDECDKPNKKFCTELSFWKRQKGDTAERPAWLPQLNVDTPDREENSNKDDEALLAIPGYEQALKGATQRIQKGGGFAFKNTIGIPVASNGRIYNDKVDPELLTVFCTDPNCTERFLDRPRMLRHVANQHKEKTHICDFEGCGKAFVDNSKLQRHYVTHSTEKNAVCEYCGAAFGLKFNLNTHMKNVHGIINNRFAAAPPKQKI